MEQHVAVLIAEVVERATAGVVARLGAFQDPGHLLVAARVDDLTNRVQVTRRHHDQHIVDIGMMIEHGQRVLQDRSPGDLDQLFGKIEPDPRADSSGQQDRHIPSGACHRYRVTVARLPSAFSLMNSPMAVAESASAEPQ